MYLLRSNLRTAVGVKRYLNQRSYNVCLDQDVITLSRAAVTDDLITVFNKVTVRMISIP